MLFISGGLYIFFSSSDLQPWNSPNNTSNKSKDAVLESELVTLKKKPEEEDDDEDYNNRKKQEEKGEKSPPIIAVNEKEKEKF